MPSGGDEAVAAATATACGALGWAGLAALAAAATGGTGGGGDGSGGGPMAVWAPASAAVWFAYAWLAGWRRIGLLEQAGVLWGALSACAFLAMLHRDGSFQGWGDVYFFCGHQHEYCTCGFRWNLLGWWKAATIWNFSIATAVGLQKLALQLGLGGLLPGEEVVTKDSFVSVCWRLVPYWLNNWEQNWGTECSSMLFEVPRFAMELLVILPCVQILCSRLKILAAAQIRVVVPEEDAAAVRRENVAVNIIKGHWEMDPSQRSLLPRLRANIRVMLFTLCLLSFAIVNSLWVPLLLEKESLNDSRAEMAMLAGKEIDSGHTLNQMAQCSVKDDSNLSILGWFSRQPSSQCHGQVEDYIGTLKNVYVEEKHCPEMKTLTWSIKKHSTELERMKDEEHQRMIPLIEITLAMMRFSCEKFFVLLTVYVNYLLFREPPPVARALVQLNSFLSSVFQHVVLYAFPAICWAYGAGIIFSTFVSLIFWGAPLMAAYKVFGKAFTHTIPKGLSPATSNHVERMGGHCAICWGQLTTADAIDAEEPSSSGSALPCSHAYHAGCLIRWMQHCLGQNRVPKCPMCQAKIEYQVRLHWPWCGEGLCIKGVGALEEDDGDTVGEDGLEEGEDFLFGDPNLQEMLEDMPDIPAEVIEGEGQVQRILGRQEVFDDDVDDNPHVDQLPGEEAVLIDGSEDDDHDLGSSFQGDRVLERATSTSDSEEWMVVGGNDPMHQEALEDSDCGCEADSRNPSSSEQIRSHRNSSNPTNGEAATCQVGPSQIRQESRGRFTLLRRNVHRQQLFGTGPTTGSDRPSYPMEHQMQSSTPEDGHVGVAEFTRQNASKSSIAPSGRIGDSR